MACSCWHIPPCLEPICPCSHSVVTRKLPLPVLSLLISCLQPILQSSAQGLSPLGSSATAFPCFTPDQVLSFPLDAIARWEWLCHYVLPYFGMMCSWVCFLCWTKFQESREQPTSVHFCMPSLQHSVWCSACKPELFAKPLNPAPWDGSSGMAAVMR